MYKNLATALRAACVSALFLSAPGLSFATTPADPGASAKAPTAPSRAPLKAAFVYVAPVTEAGWTRQHEEGRKAVQAALGAQVETTVVESVPEGADAERVIR